MCVCVCVCVCSIHPRVVPHCLRQGRRPTDKTAKPADSIPKIARLACSIPETDKRRMPGDERREWRQGELRRRSYITQGALDLDGAAPMATAMDSSWP